MKPFHLAVGALIVLCAITVFVLRISEVPSDEPVVQRSNPDLQSLDNHQPISEAEYIIEQLNNLFPLVVLASVIMIIVLTIFGLKTNRGE